MRRLLIFPVIILLAGLTAVAATASSPARQGSQLPATANSLQTFPVPIANGSFDQGVDADGVPLGWQRYAGSPDATLAIAPGGQGLILDDRDTGAEIGVVQTFALAPSVAYKVDVMARGFRDRSPDGAYVQLRFLPSQEYAQVGLSKVSFDELEWISMRAVAPEDTTSARLYLYTHRQPTPKVVVSEVVVTGGVEPPPPPPPDPVPPVYDKLKDMHTEIPLVTDGEATCTIVAPERHSGAAATIRDRIRELTGVTVPVVSDRSAVAATPLVGNVIVLGNRSTNRTSSELYDRHYSVMDLKYPGTNGYSVRTLHDPYGNGYSAVLVGGSDTAGVNAGASAFAERLTAEGSTPGELSIGWMMLTRLGDGLTVPTDIREFETWEASKNYGSIGYFGWNSISKRMAMYYMTGEPFHAREVIRLSFPDEQAIAEIEEIDGERIENKQDPLAGPYHYNAMMLILYWDLIEESPVFTDEERLAVTNAFARRLAHSQDRSTYFRTETPDGVGTRHGQWSALSLHTLARYFDKYYPDAVWAQALRAGELAFSSLDEHAWLAGENDNLFWFCTGIAPTLSYLVLSGHRAPIENGVLETLLRGQEVLISGRKPDWALNYAALDYFNKAAYLTGDGRWIDYRDRTGLDTDVFRLGQSFWPGDDIAAVPPADLVNSWLVHPMPVPMWRSRATPFDLDESFMWMSFRSAASGGGDFVLIDGFNGASRNPYHTYDILELRLAGRTLLEGYMNQVLTSADGLVEPLVPMDGQLLYHDVLGSTAIVVGQVPHLAFASWRRTLAQRTGQYGLIVDDLTFRTQSANMHVDTTWQFTSGRWDASRQAISASAPGWELYLPFATTTGRRLVSAGDSSRPNAASEITLSYELHPSDVQEVAGRNPVHMGWSGGVQTGSDRHVFYLLGRDSTNAPGELACLQIAPNAAALSLPSPAVVVAGTYEGISGDLAVLADNHLIGHNLVSAGFDEPLLTTDTGVNMEWDFETAAMHVVASAPTRLRIAADCLNALVNGEPGRLVQEGATCMVNLPTGEHLLSRITPNAPNLRDHLLRLGAEGRRRRESELSSTPEPTPSVPDLLPVTSADIGGAVSLMAVLSGTDAPQIAIAEETTIHIFTADGRLVRRMAADAEILSVRWWEKHRLLLVGCIDDQVIAFDDSGKRRWVFTSKMDPAVYETGKTYWYKTAPGHEGVRGLFTGTFLDGEEQAFVGGACTLEIIDEDGQLVERTAFFWGPGSVFQLVPKPDGSIDLLIGREPGDGAHLWAYNSRTRAKTKSFYRVPDGHTYVGGWANMARDHIFVADVAGDHAPEVVSEINGVWNRITVWDGEGTPLSNAQFGGGKSTPYRNMRDLDLVDLDGDGKEEIVAATSAGQVTALDGECGLRWSTKLASPATVVQAFPPDGDRHALILVGCEDGSVLELGAEGAIAARGQLEGTPTRIASMQSVDGPLIIIGTATGEIATFEP